MQLELFSSPGNGDSRYLVEASRPFLAGHAEPTLAYLAAATVGDNWLAYTETAYRTLARVAPIDVETMSEAEVEGYLTRAAVLLVSGGNTFVLNDRLHRSGMLEMFRRRIATGLPVVAFSAGTIVCGANILTSNDMNACATTHFGGLELVRSNFNVHYPTDPAARADRDERLRYYHAFHSNPVVALEDDAWLSVHGDVATVRQGRCRLFAKGENARVLEVGATIAR